MKKFLFRSIIFLALPVCYFTINMVINHYFCKNEPPPLKKKHILIVGDSHPQRSLNPAYFYDAHNIAQPSEPYILTYWKLKKIVRFFNPDTLIVGFAPHNISAFNDLKFSDEKWEEDLFKKAYPIEEFRRISAIIPVNFKKYYQVLWKQTAFYPKKNHFNYIGRYENNNTTNLSKWKSAIEGHYYHQGKRLGFSATAISYLDSIIDLCNRRKIKVVLVSNPLHKNYLQNIPPEILNRYVQLAVKYSKSHIVYNRTNQQYEDSFFLNADHLNEKGAKRFTKELIRYLKLISYTACQIKS